MECGGSRKCVTWSRTRTAAFHYAPARGVVHNVPVMARKVVAVFALTLMCCGVALAATSADVHGFTLADVFLAWPATGQFSNGTLERLAAMPVAIGGRAAARRDLEEGRLRLMLWGGGFPALRIYSRMLAERGIESQIVGGCVVSQPKLSAWIGYDSVMSAEIRARFGKRFLHDVAEAAEAEYERERSTRTHDRRR